MMMMFYNRTRKLPFNALSNLAFTLPSQHSIFHPTSTILPSKGANFTTIFTPFSSISKTLLNSKRFYSVHPPPPTPPTPTDDDEAPISIKDALEWYFAKSYQTVPYTNRTRRVLRSRDFEIQNDEFLSNRLKLRLMEYEDMLLPPTHPDVVRVKMIFNKIIAGLQNDLKKMGNATSSYNSIGERISMSLSRKTPPASTSHLDGLDWEVLVLNYDPDGPDTWNHFRYSVCDGKTQYIVLAHGLVNLYVGRDIELAIILSQVVARNVARHKGERLSKEFWISYLSNMLGENFTNHIGIRIVSLIRRLPFNKRLDAEADYMGLQLLKSAGYDPQQVAEAYKEIGRNWDKINIKSIMEAVKGRR